MCDKTHMNDTPPPHVQHIQEAYDHSIVIKQIQDYLTQGMTRVIVDSNDPGVVVPPNLKGELRLHLNLSRMFAGHQMKFTPQALYVTLRFDNVPFRCTLPWQAFRAASLVPKEKKPVDQLNMFKEPATEERASNNQRTNLRVIK